MAVTYIKWTLNRTNELVLYQNRENVADWLVLAPRNLVRSDFAYLRNTGIPWCDNQGRLTMGTGWNSQLGMLKVPANTLCHLAARQRARPWQRW